MDGSLDVVAEKCAVQLDMYQKCVIKNQQGNWAEICSPQRIALTRCADHNVPLLKAVKQACANEIKAYDSCLAANQSASEEVLQEKCLKSLQDLYHCTERVGQAQAPGRPLGKAAMETTRA